MHTKRCYLPLGPHALGARNHNHGGDMTEQGAKPTWRTVDTSRGPMRVGVSQHGLLIAKKGKRTTYGPIPWEAIFDLGAKYEAGVVGKTTPRLKGRGRKVNRGLLGVEPKR